MFVCLWGYFWLSWAIMKVIILLSQYRNNKNVIWHKIVPFKSLRNCKRPNKGNITSKSNSNKIMLDGGGGKYYLALNKIIT